MRAEGIPDYRDRNRFSFAGGESCAPIRFTRRPVLILFFCFLLTSVFQVSTFAEHLPIRVFSIADGLAHDQVNRIKKDSKGFLWFCTSDGLSRFDGYRFTTYGISQGLPHRQVHDFIETRNGLIWVATAAGVCVFDPRASHRSGYPENGSNEGSAPRLFTAVMLGQTSDANDAFALAEDLNGDIWCGTAAGLFRIREDRGRWTVETVNIGLPLEGNSTVNSFLEDRSGQLWISTAAGLFRRFPDGRCERYATPQGLPSDALRTLLEDSKGRIWIGGLTGLWELLVQPEGGSRLVTRAFSKRDGLPGFYINSLFEDSAGLLWVGTGWGLAVSTTSTSDGVNSFRSYTTANGLSDNKVKCVFEDRDGNLWIGTDSGGAMKLARNGFSAYDESDGLAETRIASIFEARNHSLHVVTSASFVSIFNGTQFSSSRFPILADPDRQSWGWYQTFLQDHLGDWWVPTTAGIYRYDGADRNLFVNSRPKAIYTTREGLPTNYIFRLFEDSSGDIWIGTSGHPELTLSRWDRKTGKIVSYPTAVGIPASGPTAFQEDRQGRLWIGFYDGGLVRYWQGRFTLFTSADGLPRGMIRGLYLDSAGLLWAATSEGGAARISNLESDHPVFTKYTMDDGLTSNQVTCITEDSWGRFYIGTGKGLNRLDIISGDLIHYTTSDGLANNYINVSFKDSSGSLWFGTLNGLSRLVPSPEVASHPSPVWIGSLRVAGVSYPISELGERQIEGLELSPSQGDLQVDFFGVDFKPGEVLRYQYKLEGASGDWSPALAQRSVTFANLAPGSYCFLVRSVTSAGVAGLEPASIRFVVLAPFWRRWWFISACVLIVGLAAYFLHRYRLSRLMELEGIRTRIATDLHDDIGSSLSQIAILSELAMQRDVYGRAQSSTPADMTAPADPLQTIAATSRELVDSMSDIVWSVNPRNDRLSDLVRRMRHFAADVLSSRNIDFTFQAPDSDSELRIASDVRQHLYLIFKEAINNAARHSHCTKVDIEFRFGSKIELMVKDNGNGFDLHEVENAFDGHGFISMKHRAAEIGGSLEIASEPGTGTVVRLIAVPGASAARIPRKS